MVEMSTLTFVFNCSNCPLFGHCPNVIKRTAMSVKYSDSSWNQFWCWDNPDLIEHNNKFIVKKK